MSGTDEEESNKEDKLKEMAIQTKCLFQKINVLYEVIESLKKSESSREYTNTKLKKTQDEIVSIKLKMSDIIDLGNNNEDSLSSEKGTFLMKSPRESNKLNKFETVREIKEKKKKVTTSPRVIEIKNNYIDNKNEKDIENNKIEKEPEKIERKNIKEEIKLDYGNKSTQDDTLVNKYLSETLVESSTYNDFKLNHEEMILFKKFADNEKSGENLQFLFDVYNFKEQTKLVRVSNDIYKIWFDSIYTEYFAPNSPNPLSLRDRVIKSTVEKYLNNDPTAFNRAEADISHIVREMFLRFKSNDIWISYLNSKKFREKKSKSIYYFPKSNVPSILELQKKESNSSSFFDKITKQEMKLLDNNIKPSIIDKVNEENQNEMINVSLNDKESKIKFELLKKDKNIDDIFYETILNQDLKLFLFLIYEEKLNINVHLKKGKSTAIHECVKINNIEMVEILIHEGININSLDSDSRTPLHFSSKLGLDDISILLLGNHAIVNIRDNYGYSPLFLALKSHQFDIVPNLILFGGDINFKRDNGMTILHEAMLIGDEKMMNWILKNGKIKLNFKDQSGSTPLLKSTTLCSPEMIYKFIKTPGVDFKAIDSYHRNIFHLLSTDQRVDVFNYFNNEDNDSLFSILNLKEDINHWTCLHIAIHKSNLNLVISIHSLSLKWNIDLINLKDKKDQTPLQLCERLLLKNDNDYDIEKLKQLEDIKNYLIDFKKQKWKIKNIFKN
eukprot:gene9878-2200_t